MMIIGRGIFYLWIWAIMRFRLEVKPAERPVAKKTVPMTLERGPVATFQVTVPQGHRASNIHNDLDDNTRIYRHNLNINL